MKVSNEDKVLIGAGVVALGGLGFLYWRKKKQERESSQPEVQTVEPVAPTTPKETPTSNPQPVQGAKLDKNKLLKKGSKGIEVRELQRLLKVAIDGVFGNITQTALQNAKGVNEISINAFLVKSSKPVVTTIVLPKKGQKLQAIANNFHVFKAQKTASGGFFNSGERSNEFQDLDYGEHVGTFVSAGASGKFLIIRNGAYYFVEASKVKAY